MVTILIIIGFTGTSAVTGLWPEFNNRESCEIARTLVLRGMGAPSPSWTAGRFTECSIVLCVPKG